MFQTRRSLIAATVVLALAGCSAESAPSTAQAPPSTTPLPPPPPAPPGRSNPPLVNPIGDGTANVPPGVAPLPISPETATQQTNSGGGPSIAPGMEAVKAQKGVGIKGRSLDEHEGMVVTPVKAFFAAKERIAFEIEVPHALQLYKATDIDGKAPKDWAEFKEKIIDANQIKLPQLPPGHEYSYDPTTEELLVIRPKK